MKNPEEPTQFIKSPLIFLLLIGILVVSTLVVASEYFLRPQIEAELQKEPTQYFSISSLKETSKAHMSDQEIID